MMSHLSCRVEKGGIRELLDGKIWEWDLSFRWEWEWDGNVNEVIEMGGNWYEKSVPAHLYSGGVLSTVDTVVQRRDGPRWLHDDDYDDDDDRCHGSRIQ